MFSLARRILLIASVALLSQGVSVSPALGGVSTQSLTDPDIHYTFDTDLLDSKSGSTLTAAPACPNNPCNSAASFGSDSNGKYWTWTSTDNRGGGFTLLTNAAIGNTYTIALKFSFNTVTSWRKIIDYENRVSDNGFYYYQQKLQFYNGGSTFNSTTTYPANTVLDLVVVREATTGVAGTFTVYGVGSDNSLTQLFQYSDTTGNSIPHLTVGGETKLGFFFDDIATSSEATPNGKVYDLRIWAGDALTPQTLSEVATRPSQATNVVATPQPQSVVVSWSQVSGATSYIATVGTQTCTVNAPTTTCTITGLTDGAAATAQVQAVGPGGYSEISTAASVVVGATTTTAPMSTTTVASTSQNTSGSSIATSGSSSDSSTSSSTELPQTGTSMTFIWWALVLLGSGAAIVLRSQRRRSVAE